MRYDRLSVSIIDLIVVVVVANYRQSLGEAKVVGGGPKGEGISGGGEWSRKGASGRLNGVWDMEDERGRE